MMLIEKIKSYNFIKFQYEPRVFTIEKDLLLPTIVFGDLEQIQTFINRYPSSKVLIVFKLDDLLSQIKNLTQESVLILLNQDHSIVDKLVQLYRPNSYIKHIYFINNLNIQKNIYIRSVYKKTDIYIYFLEKMDQDESIIKMNIERSFNVYDKHTFDKLKNFFNQNEICPKRKTWAKASETSFTPKIYPQKKDPIKEDPIKEDPIKEDPINLDEIRIIKEQNTSPKEDKVKIKSVSFKEESFDKNKIFIFDSEKIKNIESKNQKVPKKESIKVGSSEEESIAELENEVYGFINSLNSNNLTESNDIFYSENLESLVDSVFTNSIQSNLPLPYQGMNKEIVDKILEKTNLEEFEIYTTTRSDSDRTISIDSLEKFELPFENDSKNDLDNLIEEEQIQTNKIPLEIKRLNSSGYSISIRSDVTPIITKESEEKKSENVNLIDYSISNFDPIKIDPIKIDPIKIDPIKIDPIKIDPNTKKNPQKIKSEIIVENRSNDNKLIDSIFGFIPTESLYKKASFKNDPFGEIEISNLDSILIPNKELIPYISPTNCITETLFEDQKKSLDKDLDNQYDLYKLDIFLDKNDDHKDLIEDKIQDYFFDDINVIDDNNYWGSRPNIPNYSNQENNQIMEKGTEEKRESSRDRSIEFSGSESRRNSCREFEADSDGKRSGSIKGSDGKIESSVSERIPEITSNTESIKIEQNQDQNILDSDKIILESKQYNQMISDIKSDSCNKDKYSENDLTIMDIETVNLEILKSNESESILKKNNILSDSISNMFSSNNNIDLLNFFSDIRKKPKKNKKRKKNQNLILISPTVEKNSFQENEYNKKVENIIHAQKAEKPMSALEKKIMFMRQRIEKSLGSFSEV